MAGLKKESGQVRRKDAATMDMLAWLAAESGSARSAETRKTIVAAATVAFFFMLRASEYVRTAARAAPMPHVLRQRHVSFARGGSAVPWRQRASTDEVILVVRSSKTDQAGQGTALNLFATGHPVLCPVRAMASVSRPSGRNDDLPVFLRADGEPVTRDQMGRAAKRAAVGTGRDPARYSTHSFRSGGATALVAQGISVAAIKRLGR